MLAKRIQNKIWKKFFWASPYVENVLFLDVWKECSVAQEWYKCILISISLAVRVFVYYNMEI
jgi:hypothetical protein